MSDIEFMQLAYKQARLAASEGEVPVGAVLVLGDKLIASGYNLSISNNDPTAHAEVVVLRRAAQQLQNYRMPGVRLYVTLEPCMMCLGAMQHARVSHCIYAASDPKTGVLGGCCDLLCEPCTLHKMQISHGIMQQECSELLQDFFQCRR